MIRMAFLFRVNRGKEKETYVVKIARCIDYRYGEVGWMDDSDLPVYDEKTDVGTLVPDIDLTEESHPFDDYDAAMIFIARHYESELRRVSLPNL